MTRCCACAQCAVNDWARRNFERYLSLTPVAVTAVFAANGPPRPKNPGRYRAGVVNRSGDARPTNGLAGQPQEEAGVEPGGLPGITPMRASSSLRIARDSGLQRTAEAPSS